MEPPIPSIDDLYLAALERPSGDDRTRYLDEACAGHPEVRQRVERLLAAQSLLGSFLEAPAPEIGATRAPCPSEGPGTVIGPYKLLQQIGEGGMGIVFMADQIRPVHRRVALKVIKPGMDSRQIVARFEAERQALAMMDHANIARVFDGGTTENGRPYFVMELVHGVPITRYCDDHHLTPRERLELFVPVCQAIQHAHQKGVIHRDVKPSNVLVTLYDGRPVPKVIDFGVAKAIEQKLTEQTLFTQYGTLVGTLEYMSPEQAEMSALGVDTRSDIYSLGVLLYELLTGSTPLTRKQMKEAAYADILRIIKEEEPPTPSTRLFNSGEALASISANRHTEPAKLTKLVRGELDWIVMKCLEKDRSRRYETVSGFAADLQRYLADEPVQACPPSAGYRFRKFVRRNRAPLTMSLVVAIAMLFLVGSVGWVVRERAAREAETERDRVARRTGIEREVQLALAEAEQWYQRELWSEALSAVKRAEGVLTRGGVHDRRDQVQQFRRDLEMILRVSDIRQQAAENLDATAASHAYARVFAELGVDVLAVPAESAVARILARPRIAVQLAIALDHWAIVTEAPETAESLIALAQAIDPDPKRSQVREAAKRRDTNALAALAASPDLGTLPPVSLITLASSLQHVGLFDTQIDVLRSAQRQYPNDFWVNQRLTQSLKGMGPERLDEAIMYARITLALRPQRLPTYTTLGILLGTKGQLHEAIQYFQKARDVNPVSPQLRYNLAIAYRKHGRPEDAIADYREAIRLKSDFAAAHNNLAILLQEQQRWEEGLIHAEQAVRWKCPEAYRLLSSILDQLGRLDQFAAIYARVNNPPASERLRNPVNGHLYQRLGVAGLSWHEAERLCRSLGGHLATIDSKQENDFLYNSFATDHVVWLGGTDELHEGRWEWITGEPFAYQNWYPPEPNNASGEHYLMMGSQLISRPATGDRYFRFGSFWNDLYASGSVFDMTALTPLCEWETAPAPSVEPFEANARLALAHFTLGTLLQEEDRGDEAAAAYRKAIECDADHAAAHQRLGALHLERSGLTDVDSFVEQADRPPALADAYKQVSGAVACFEKAARVIPRSFDAHLGLGEALRLQGRLDEAAASLQRAIELKPSDAEPYFQRGLVHRDGWQHDRAIADFSKAIELHHWHENAWEQRHRAYQNQFHLALADYTKDVERRPDRAIGWYYRGLAREGLEQYSEALTDYSEAIRLKPDFTRVWYARGKLFDRYLQQPEKAMADFSRAIELRPESVWGIGACRDRGRIYEARKQWPEALADAGKVVELSPHSVVDQIELAWLLLTCPDRKVRDPHRARSLAEAVVESDPNCVEGWKILGVAQYRSGDWQAAGAALDMSQKLGETGDGSDEFFVAMVRWQLGDEQDARHWYERAVAWMDQHRPNDEELLQLRTEAAELLGAGRARAEDPGPAETAPTRGADQDSLPLP